MSTIVWEGSRLFQNVGGRRAELGYIRHARGKFILMLRGESLGLPSNHYLTGDEWNTIKEAKEKAAGCLAASLAHSIWMMQSPEDIEKVKAGVQDAPLSQLKEVVGWLKTAVSIAEIGRKLFQIFCG